MLCKKGVQACNFNKKETLAQVLSCEFCEISKNTFFTEDLRETASESYEWSYNDFSSQKVSEAKGHLG